MTFTDPEYGPHCGRLDNHAPHEWIGDKRQPVIRDCPGAPVIEGGHLKTCDGCGEKTLSVDLSPTCNEHTYCRDCAPHALCSECRYERVGAMA